MMFRMKLLVFSLLFCGASARVTASENSVPETEEDLGADGTLGGGFGKSVLRSTGFWQAFNGRSFLFVTDAVSWAHAQQDCLAMGGNLATIHNKQEQEFVQSVAEGQTAWIGFSDAQENRYWFWINSNPLSYTNWCPGEPNNYPGIQNCAVINYTDRGCWDNDVCSKRFPFVCERKEESN